MTMNSYGQFYYKCSLMYGLKMLMCSFTAYYFKLLSPEITFVRDMDHHGAPL